MAFIFFCFFFALCTNSFVRSFASSINITGSSLVISHNRACIFIGEITDLMLVTREIKPLASKKHFPSRPKWNKTKKIPLWAWRGRFFMCSHVYSLPRDQFPGPWLFSTAEARTSSSPYFHVQFKSIHHQHSRGCVMVNGSTALQHGTSRPWPARASRAFAAAHSSSLSCQPRPAAPPAEHGAPSTTEVESKKQRNPEAGMGFYFRGAGHVHVDERTCEWRGPVAPPSTTSALTRHHRPSGGVPTTTTTVARAAVCRAPLNHQVECVWLMICRNNKNNRTPHARRHSVFYGSKPGSDNPTRAALFLMRSPGESCFSAPASSPRMYCAERAPSQRFVVQRGKYK